METNGHKKVIQYSDQFFCSWCGKTWDANDPHPPECSEKQKSFRTVHCGRESRHRVMTTPPAWPTPPQAYYLQRRGVGFVVWADGPKEAFNYAVRVGLRPNYMRRIDVPDRAYSVKTPRAEINPLTLELVRSRYPNFGEIITPSQYAARKKDKKK